MRAEQGFGDGIQFARYLPLISQAGGAPVLVCAPSLLPLMRSIPGVRAVATSDRPPEYDAWVDQASLPALFGTTLDTIPGADGYLSADPVRVRTWNDRLPAGRRVGIVLMGNPKHSADRRRSVPADFGVALPDVPDLRFISLRHGGSAGVHGLPDLTRWMTDYAETAALIENLDLVVTVDTSVAHLAAALGKPTWILLPHAPDWRWMLSRPDSPWYRSVRLFRQPSPGDWGSVLGRVMEELSAGYPPE